MNKILYSPKEGTTGFWGLRGVRMKPRECPGRGFCSCDDPPVKRCEVLAWEDDLESCKSNKLEIIGHIPGIVSGCEVGLMFLENGGAKLKPGDLFDIPEGYEFKEEELPCRCECDGTCHCFAGKCEGKPKVLRLVKTETFKERFTKLFPQPEPEESQHEMFTELLKLFTEFGYKKVLQNFIIQRKKQ